MFEELKKFEELLCPFEYKTWLLDFDNACFQCPFIFDSSCPTDV